jgi:hypothetical protein
VGTGAARIEALRLRRRGVKVVAFQPTLDDVATMV